ncbi:TPA: hypothetical protein N2D16_002885 [Clostridium botulinum]|nr:hypothetical protein [Clostridium botulinum]
MNIKNLTKGMIIKNYKELCEILEVKTKGGDAKKAQLKELSYYCKYTKEGHKFIIQEVYKKPLPIQDKRLNSNTYVEEIGDIILEYLYKNDTNKLLSLSNLMEILGIVNPSYNVGYNNKKELSEILELNIFDLNYFYDNTRNEFKKIIERALNNLKSRKVLEWHRQLTFIRKVYNNDLEKYFYSFEVATDKQVEEIINIEKEIMQELNCKNSKEVFLKRLSKKLYKESTKRILNKYSDKSYIGYFRAYKLYIGDRAIKIEYDNIKEKRQELNSKIKNKSNKLLKNYKYKDMLIGKLIDLLKHDMSLDNDVLELKENNNTKKFIEKLNLELKLSTMKEQKLKEIDIKYSDDIDIEEYLFYINNSIE